MAAPALEERLRAFDMLQPCFRDDDTTPQLIAELRRCGWIGPGRIAEDAVEKMLAWRQPPHENAGIRTFVERILNGGVGPLPQAWSGVLVNQCVRFTREAASEQKALRARAAAGGGGALPAGMHVPRFDDDDDMAALLSRLRRCGWVCAAGLSEEAVAAIGRRWHGSGAACHALRCFVGDAIFGRDPRHVQWSAAAVEACAHAAQGSCRGRDAPQRRRSRSPPPRRRTRSRSRSRSPSRAARRRSRERRRSPSPEQQAPVHWPPGALMPRFRRGDTLDELLDALAAAGWVSEAEGGGIPERTMQKLREWDPPEAAATAVRRLVARTDMAAGVNLSGVAIQMCIAAQLELRGGAPHKRRSRSRSREREREPAAARRDAPPAKARAQTQAESLSAPQAPPEPPPAVPPPVPPAPPVLPAAAAAPPPPRFHYRNPQNGAIEGPFKLSVFRGWVAAGALSTSDAASLRVWRAGAEESQHSLLGALLAADAGQ
jgi:hypothetical protein